MLPDRHRAFVALTALALLAAAGDARADFRFAIGNDVFTTARPIGSDDNGFTNDLDLHFWRPWREYQLGVRLFDRWITEETPMAGRRRDLVDLLATGERAWGPPERSFVAGARVGPSVTGNLGGRWTQNAFHTTCGCGRTLDEGLQDSYDGGTAAGVLAGGRATGAIGVPLAQMYASLDGQLSLGTGVSSVEGAVGARILGSSGRNRYGGHVELAANRFHVVDERLALPGAYRPGWHGSWRIGVGYARARVRVELEYRSDEDGSGQPFGILALTFKQAGTAF